MWPITVLSDLPQMTLHGRNLYSTERNSTRLQHKDTSLRPQVARWKLIVIWDLSVSNLGLVLKPPAFNGSPWWEKCLTDPCGRFDLTTVSSCIMGAFNLWAPTMLEFILGLLDMACASCSWLNPCLLLLLGPLFPHSLPGLPLDCLLLWVLS
jgi:hypothetical protein